MPGHDIIVIGASSGGVEALMTLVHAFPSDLPAAVLVVLHIPAQSPTMLPHILGRRGALPVVAATDGVPITYGQIYVAPPDQHLLVARGHVHVVRGPKENRVRPAIDPLFRTAARAYGPRVVGVVLTGALDDGTAGLLAIKRRGGIAIVQDPAEAAVPSMPRSALRYVAVDYTLALADMAAVLMRLAHEPAEAEGADVMSDNVELEADIAAMDAQALQRADRFGHPVALTCPDCGGVLSKFSDGPLLRFRCQVGHAYSAQSAVDGQAAALDHALWNAFKSLDERVTLLQHLADDAQHRGDRPGAWRFEQKVREVEKQKEQMHQVLLTEAAGAVLDPSSERLTDDDQPDRVTDAAHGAGGDDVNDFHR